MTLIIITMAIGSFIVAHFNYALLFILAASLNTIGIIPYLIYARFVRMHEAP